MLADVHPEKHEISTATKYRISSCKRQFVWYQFYHSHRDDVYLQTYIKIFFKYTNLFWIQFETKVDVLLKKNYTNAVVYNIKKQ
jgi:hypothetical protein